MSIYLGDAFWGTDAYFYWVYAWEQDFWDIEYA